MCDMKISFLGTGASEGVPAMFCSCEYCNHIRELGGKEYRTRTQVLIDGDLSVDFPPEAYAHSLAFGVNLSDVNYLLVTHSHMDHFYAHDFILRGYKYARLTQPLLEIYGDEEVKSVFDECTRREMKEEVSPHVKFTVTEPYTEFMMGEYRVISLPAMHKTEERALLYYIEKGGKGYLHLYDTGDLSDEAITFLKERGSRVSAAAFDCTFLDAPYKSGLRHMCIDGVMRLFARLEKAGICDSETVKIITHFSHNSNPTTERLKTIESKYGVVAAYDGFTIKI